MDNSNYYSSSSSSSSTSSDICKVPQNNSLRFHDYEKKEKLGHGGFGKVYHVTDSLVKTDFAIKKIYPDRDDSPDVVLREAEALAKLEHEGLVRFHAAWVEHTESTGLENLDDSQDSSIEEDGEEDTAPWRLYIKMELCETSLDKWLEDNKTEEKRPRLKMLDKFYQLLAAVDYIHTNGYMHRDIKPANIFLCKGSVKLGDLGLIKRTKVKTPEVLDPKTYAHGHTENVGTALYMAPEQTKCLVYNNKIDIFALGIVLLELLIPLSTTHEKMKTLQPAGNGVLPPELQKAFPEEFKLLQWLCAVDPESRPSASEVLGSDHCKNFLREVAANINDFSRGAQLLLLKYGAGHLVSPNADAWKKQALEEIELEKDIFVETPAFHKAVQHLLERDSLMVTGPPGCGKSLSTRQLLGHFCRERSAHLQPLIVRQPADLKKVLPLSEPVTLLVDDVFGRINFLPDTLLQWNNVLNELTQSHLGHKIACTSRTDVFLQAKKYFGGAPIFQTMETLHFHEENCSLPIEIKIDIFSKHLEKRPTQTLSKKTVGEICFDELPCFPQSIEMYLRRPQSFGDPREFFRHPLAAFAKHLRAVFQKGDSFQTQVLVLAILGDGVLDFEIWQHPSRPLREDLCKFLSDSFGLDVRKDWEKIHAAALSLIGTYLLWHTDSSGHPVLVFLHPSVHDAAVNVLCENHSDFMIRKHNVKFLLERVGVSDEEQPNVLAIGQVCLPRSKLADLADRIVDEIIQGNMGICSHAAFGNETFLDIFWKAFHKHAKFVDTIKKQSLLYWSTWSPTSKLFGKVLKEIIQSGISADMDNFATEAFQCAVACCLNGNAAALQMLLESSSRGEIQFSLIPQPQLHGTIPFPASTSGRSNEAQPDEAALPRQPEDAPQFPTDAILWKGSLLHIACLHEQEEVVDILLRQGLDANAKDGTGRTPLHVAARYSGLSVVRKLVEAGANVSLTDSEQRTAFHEACAVGDALTAEWLVSQKSDLVSMVDDMRRNGLHLAAVSGATDLVVYLVTRKEMSLDVVDKNGELPLQMACARPGNSAVLRKLAELNANLQVRSPRLNDTLLHMVCKYTNDVSMLNTLVELGANVNAFNKRHQAPLHLACQKNRFRMVETLVRDHNADVFIIDNHSQKPSDVTSCDEIKEFLSEKMKEQESVQDSESS